MKTVLIFLVLLYGVHCSDKIHPKDPCTVVEPKAELTIQRLTLPVQWVGGLYWNKDGKMLGYPDVLAAKYHMWYKETGKTDQIFLKELAGHQFKFVLPIKNKKGSYLAAVDGGLRIITRSSGTYSVSKPVLELKDKHLKITNGHCDPKGRLFFGTHATCNSLAKLYKVENGELHVMNTKGKCFDDLMWSMDFKYLYVISDGGTIWQFLYDMDKGTLGDHPKLAFNIIEHPTLGTTMTSIETDDNGTLWVSAKPKGMLMNINPVTTKVLQSKKLPVGSPSTITFGGNLGKDLYVGTKMSCPLGSNGEGSVYVVSGFSTCGTYDRPVVWPN
ncbi:Senescence marker protein-30 [Carabus blaptoides fortunei]